MQTIQNLLHCKKSYGNTVSTVLWPPFVPSLICGNKVCIPLPVHGSSTDRIITVSIMYTFICTWSAPVDRATVYTFICTRFHEQRNPYRVYLYQYMVIPRLVSIMYTFTNTCFPRVQSRYSPSDGQKDKQKSGGKIPRPQHWKMAQTIYLGYMPWKQDTATGTVPCGHNSVDNAPWIKVCRHIFV